MSVRAKLLISYGAMTGLVVAMAGITAFVSYLHHTSLARIQSPRSH